MFKALFGDINNGRLARLPFLGYWILICAIIIIIGFGVGAAIGVAENLAGGDIQNAQARLQDQFGILGLLLLAVISAAVLFAGLNLEAKRIRDIGLPGWWTVLATVVVSAVISLAISQQAGSGFNFLIWLALLLIPTNTFGDKSVAGV